MSYIKNGLRPVTLENIQEKYSSLNIETTIDSITLNRYFNKCKKLIIIGVYRPPHTPVSWFSTFDELILELLPLGHLMIAGDVNSDLLKPKIYPGKTFLKSLKLAGCTVHSSEPTRVTPLANLKSILLLPLT